jgi:hypothetical protein
MSVRMDEAFLQGYAGSRESYFDDWTRTGIGEVLELGNKPTRRPEATCDVITLFVTPTEEVRVTAEEIHEGFLRIVARVGSYLSDNPSRAA